MARRLPSAPPVLPGYSHLHVLGTGGSAVVYAAEQVGLKRVVAFKLFTGATAPPGVFPGQFQRTLIDVDGDDGVTARVAQRTLRQAVDHDGAAHRFSSGGGEDLDFQRERRAEIRLLEGVRVEPPPVDLDAQELRRTLEPLESPQGPDDATAPDPGAPPEPVEEESPQAPQTR